MELIWQNCEAAVYPGNVTLVWRSFVRCLRYLQTFPLNVVQIESILQYEVEEYMNDCATFNVSKSVHVQAHFDGEPIEETKYVITYYLPVLDIIDFKYEIVV